MNHTREILISQNPLSTRFMSRTTWKVQSIPLQIFWWYFSDEQSIFLQLCYIFDMRGTISGARQCSLAYFFFERSLHTFQRAFPTSRIFSSIGVTLLSRGIQYFGPWEKRSIKVKTVSTSTVCPLRDKASIFL
jgi:hypothetical protein